MGTLWVDVKRKNKTIRAVRAYEGMFPGHEKETAVQLPLCSD